MYNDKDGIPPKLEETLKDMNIGKEGRKEFSREKISEFFYTFLENSTYITTKILTGDFLNSLGYNVYRGSTDALQNLRRVLSHAFTPLLSRAKRDGKIIKFNTYSYKVI